MDNQFSSPNPGERGAGPSPEDLRPTYNPEQASTFEAAPAPAQQPGQAAPPTRLTQADVAAAIAAVPGPSGPGSMAQPVPTPTTAEDVDLIEPEWVAKAEDAVQRHIGDPYGEEEAIEELQEDYLQKRYGYNVVEPKAENGKSEST